MIITFVLGGLGNQLFQYALGRTLSYINNVPLKIETAGFHFKKYKLHPYGLDKFNIKADYAVINDYIKVIPNMFFRFPIIREKTSAFDRTVLNIKDHAILFGYWHSEKYFRDIAPIIRQDLTLRDPVDSATRILSEMVLATQSVSVHVRRTDYISKPQNARVFEVCSLSYYHEAIKRIAQSTASPHFFVFSDDPDWAKENVKINYPITFVSHNDANYAHRDLMLMRICKHNIIANSTFSWWGAWLNDNPDKIVIAPKKWFKRSSFDEPDLIPGNWIKL